MTSPLTGAGTRSPSPPRVLVVEDAELARTTLLAVLGRGRFEARATGSIAGAREQIDSWHPHCVLLDRRLPDGDGVEFARGLRAQPSGAALGIVIMSGDLLPDDARDLADAVLLKPATAVAVLDAVAASLAR